MADEEEHHAATGWHDLSDEMREYEEERPRIEYLGTLCLLARESVLVEHDGDPGGVSQRQLLLLNVQGHIHPFGPASSCVPMELPFLLDRDDVDRLIAALTTSAAEMDAAERGDRG